MPYTRTGHSGLENYKRNNSVFERCSFLSINLSQMEEDLTADSCSNCIPQDKEGGEELKEHSQQYREERGLLMHIGVTNYRLQG